MLPFDSVESSVGSCDPGSATRVFDALFGIVFDALFAMQRRVRAAIRVTASFCKSHPKSCFAYEQATL